MSLTRLTTDRTATRSNQAWRRGDDRHEIKVSGYIDNVANGTNSALGKVKAGTFVGKKTGTELYLPVGIGVVPTGAASATQTLGDASPFSVGDSVQFYQADGTTTIGAPVTIDAKAGNVLTLSASVTTVNDSVVRRLDGSEVPVGVLALDVSTVKGHDEAGDPVHGRAAAYILKKAWIDWRYIVGANDTLKTAVQALGTFVIEN